MGIWEKSMPGKENSQTKDRCSSYLGADCGFCERQVMASAPSLMLCDLDGATPHLWALFSLP